MILFICSKEHTHTATQSKASLFVLHSEKHHGGRGTPRFNKVLQESSEDAWFVAHSQSVTRIAVVGGGLTRLESILSVLC